MRFQRANVEVTVSVSSAAALIDSFGMQAVINDNTAMYVRDDNPASEKHYRARFHFDPNSITMAANDNHYIFAGLQGVTTIIRLQLQYANGSYRLAGGILNDATVTSYTSFFTITDEPHTIEIEWQAATESGANDGFLSLWIDGVLKGTRSGIDNDTRRVDEVRLGPWSGIDTGTRGTYYFDDFVSGRVNYIGP